MERKRLGSLQDGLDGLSNGGTCFDGLHDREWERLGGLHSEEERLDDLYDRP